ncbi:MAG: hypothetical protein JRL30_22115 [Deltaproteobacteria bacterium]|nr:hypothetical protein [Deltaproteobacteria bacterium]
MKIKIEGDKIVKVVKKVDGIEIVLENPGDAKEGIDLILRKTGLFAEDAYKGLKEIKVTAFRKYETSAVDYKMIFLLEFLFEDDVPLDARVSAIRELQALFDKV